MSACPDENTLVSFMQGGLAPDARAHIEAHLDGCAACASVLAAVARSFTVGGGPRPEATPGGTHLLPAPQSPVARGPASPRVGRYHVLELLGRGAMGTVYAARDPLLERTVALKVLHRPDEGGLATNAERLLREARALARLPHPNVVSVYDVGSHEGHVFLAMELVHGTSLTRWLQHEVRPWRVVLDAFVQAGRGLAAAHYAGLSHRDFKPDNVLVGHDGRVRVTDFGLVREHGHWDARREHGPWSPPGAPRLAGAAAHDPKLTAEGALLGTPAYMSPEQLFGNPVGPASDQFSFCVALYEALYGVRPYNGRTIEELRAAMAHSALPLPPPGGNVPPWILPILARGLSKDPASRYPSMDALLERIEAGLRPPPNVHVRVNAFVQVLMFVVHFVACTLFLFALMKGASAAGEGAAATSEPAGSAIDATSEVLAGLFVILLLCGWLPAGLVWTPLNAYGLVRERRWAVVSTLVYAMFSLPTCVGTPFAVYALVSLWGQLDKMRDPYATASS